MQYVGSYIFNRGQEISLRRGPKIWRATVQLFNTDGFPFRYLEGKDLEKLLYRALELVRRDVEKDGQELEVVDDLGVSDGNLDWLPPMRTESDRVQEFVEAIQTEGIIDQLRTNIRLSDIERRSYGHE